ncbi:MAG: PorT family protein [Fibromonadaceae bacterium]|nr:PorT family protein [Fibromonadaceae bacterium]
MRQLIVRTGSACLLFVTLCFAQNAPEKLAIYVSGASGGINKSLGSKLLSAMSQSGNYTQIADPALLQEELASSGKDDLAYIAQAAKRHGAEYVCVVSMTEAFGAHSVTARLARVSDLQIIKTGTTDRALRSLDDLTAVSNELARQLLPPGSYVPSTPAALAVAPAVVTGKEAPVDDAPVAASSGQCEKTYNLNELVYKIKDGFPIKLKDCSSTLAKDMLTPASFGGHKLEPKSFLTQCSVDGIKNELPEGFPNKDKIVGSLTNFMQGIMNTAMAGGAVDPKKLLSAVASMDIMGLVNDVKKLAADECVVDEPYEPPAAPAGKDDGEEKDKSSVSFGIRVGANFSHTYGEYDVYSRRGWQRGDGNYGDVLGLQAGFVVDFPVSNWFHIQPGLMYIQRGTEDAGGSTTAHYIQLPLLLSFKLSALRLNAGPYFDFFLAENGTLNYGSNDFGLSTGIGFDIGMFYIGAFHDYGFFNILKGGYYGYIADYKAYNRTLGLNLGINL